MDRRIVMSLVLALALAPPTGCATTEETKGDSADSEETKETSDEADESPAETDESREETRLDELAGNFETYYRETTIPVDALGARRVLKERIRQKRERLSALEDRLHQIIQKSGDDEPERAAAALYRFGEVNLNMGCELARLEPPPRLDEKQASALRERILSSTTRYFDIARRTFDKLRESDAPTRQEEARTVLESFDGDADASKAELFQQICRATRSIWKKATVRLADEKAAECRDGDADACRVAAQITSGDDRRSYLKRGCNAGDGDQCVELGEVVLEDSPADALRLFEKACDQGSTPGCRRARLVTVPEERAAYAESCRAGEPMGCLKFARIVRGDDSPEMFGTCTADGGPSADTSDAVADACLDEESYTACIRRAAGLLEAPEPREAVPEREVEGLDEGGMIGTVGERRDKNGGAIEATVGDPEPYFERMDEKCYDEQPTKCYEAGLKARDTDRDPIPWFKRGCDGGHRRSCHLLGVERLKNDELKKGLGLLDENCLQGHTSSCDRLSKTWVSGEAISANRSCAAFYEWYTCSAEAAYCGLRAKSSSDSASDGDDSEE